MAILPPTPQQPIYVQAVAPTEQVQPILIKSIDWFHKKNNPSINSRNTASLPEKINVFIESIRSDLAKLRQLHRAIMEAEYFDNGYKKNNANKEEEYANLLKRVNELSRVSPSQEVLNELQIIEDELELDCVNIDTIFPQILYKATYMERLMAIRVELIGYAELKAEALAALNGIRSSKSELNITTNLEQKNNNFTPISTVVRVINIYDEMQQYKKNILALQLKDQERATITRKRVLWGITVTFLILIGALLLLNSQAITWRYIRNYPILGIPMGIVIWSFIGSFAAMLTQFYQKPVHQFGNTLKWVIIRPVLGIVMGAAVYLALYSLVLPPTNTNSLLPLLVAFFVGYSDTFTFDLLNTIQRTITGMFSANKNSPEDAQKAPVASLPIQPIAVISQEDPPIKTVAATTPEQPPIPVRPTLTVKDKNIGEDE